MPKKKFKIKTSNGKYYFIRIIIYLLIIILVWKLKYFFFIYYHLLDWIVVRFIDDNIIKLYPGKSLKKKIDIGQQEYVKWDDGLKYLAVIIKKGSELRIFRLGIPIF